jgi:GTP-binding protein Era
MTTSQSPTPAHRAGFVAIIGRPNVGKSTLLNKAVGERLAIISPKPQTTRHRIMGVVTKPNFQVAFLDTPGIHQARGELNKFMVDVALNAMTEVDVVLFLVEATVTDGRVEIGEGNKFILDKLKRAGKPVVLGINKIDLIEKPKVLLVMDTYQKAFPFAEIYPLSGLKGDGVDGLLDLLSKHLPEGERMFPEDTITDQAERVIVSEQIREKILRFCRQEVPYSTAVVVDGFDESDRGDGGTPNNPKGLIRIQAIIFVERESQKAIVIGKGGTMLKKLGTEARKDIERFLGSRVYLELTVRVEPRWSERRDALEKMGYSTS